MLVVNVRKALKVIDDSADSIWTIMSENDPHVARVKMRDLFWAMRNSAYDLIAASKFDV